MDRNRNRRLKLAKPAAPADPLLAAVNEQVVPQLAHLANGPLAVAAFEALRAAIANTQSVSCEVLRVRVQHNDKLYTLLVQVAASP